MKVVPIRLNINTGVSDTGSAVYTQEDNVDLGYNGDNSDSASMVINVAGDGTYYGAGKYIKSRTMAKSLMSTFLTPVISGLLIYVVALVLVTQVKLILLSMVLELEPTFPATFLWIQVRFPLLIKLDWISIA